MHAGCSSWPGATWRSLRNADGEWEVVQFQTATLIAPGTYVLSRLLRGQGGSEFAMRPSVAAGARFVLFNTAVARVDLAASEIRLPLLVALRAGDARHRRCVVRGRRAYVPGAGPEAAVAGACAGGARRRRRCVQLDAAHAHRRRQLGDAGGAARRGLRELRGRHSRRRQRGAHADGERAGASSIRRRSKRPTSARRSPPTTSASTSSRPPTAAAPPAPRRCERRPRLPCRPWVPRHARELDGGGRVGASLLSTSSPRRRGPGHVST